MSGVSTLLELLRLHDKTVVVVTNSKKEHVELIVHHLPDLQKISNWVYREDSPEPKPSPKPYLIAIERFAPNCQNPIGFEDSLKGLDSLVAAKLTPVLIAPYLQPHHAHAYYFSSFANSVGDLVLF